jgi:flagellar protein FlbT
VHCVFEAANFVSQGDFYKALRALRPLMKREAEILGANVPRPASLRDDARGAPAHMEEQEPALRREVG